MLTLDPLLALPTVLPFGARYFCSIFEYHLRKLSPVIDMYSSIWHQSCTMPSFPTVHGDLKTDVLIIGGGMAGILTAWYLKQSGVDCLVLEADTIGGGVTANTTAKITSQHCLIYSRLLQSIGHERAKAYWQAHEHAIEKYRLLSQRYPCDLENRDHFVYSLDDPARLEGELEALSRLGIPSDFSSELPIPMPTAGAVRFFAQAQFHPLKLISGLAAELNIREHSRVLSLEKGKAITEHGLIRADKIVVATHFPILNRRGLYFMKQYQSRSYVLALAGAQQLPGMYLDGSGEGLSFRNYGEYLLLGGGAHRTGKPSPGWIPLTSFASAHYPGCREEARWAAQDCMTLDSVPYIGRYSPGTPWLYVATGFNKWGMTGSMTAAQILSRMVCGEASPWQDVFDPARSIWKKQLAVNMAESAVHFLRPRGPRCPHLGCRLEWNRMEHSWDCPCHGSRFDANGNILEDPAVRNMKKDRL